MPESSYDPTQDTHSITITEKQINVQLASAAAKSIRKLHNPRLHMERDCIWFACEIGALEANCVLSVQSKPKLTLS